MKVLLIGGCGFIGSHVCDSLLARGVHLRVLDRRPEVFRSPLPGVEYVFADMSNTSEMFEALSGVQAVIHLASTTVPSTASLDPIADITGNLVGTVRLLEMMRASGVRRIVYLSSGGTVYGIPQTDPVSETHPLHPINSYGIVKAAVENYLYMEHRLHGLQHIILRPSNPYGPRQGHTGVQGIIGTFLWRIARGEPIEVWGDGSVVRDFIHVRELAELCALAVLSDETGYYNAGSGVGTSVAEIVETMSRSIRATDGSMLTPIFKSGRPYDVPRVVLDISRAQSAFAWSPHIDLDEGIAETWEWVRSRT